MLETAPSLTDQIHDAIVAEICDGRLAPGTHLVQERLAERFGVSRQPIQQAMARLRADGLVEECGRRGLFVTALDPARMREHYGIRAALDGWAARAAARRIAAEPVLKGALAEEGRHIFEAARRAVAAGDVLALMRCDDAFHFLVYRASGNAMVATTAEPHWRFLRRAMVDVLREAEAPAEIWRQHGEIFAAITAGDAEAAERLAVTHVERAAALLAAVLRNQSPRGGER